MRKKFLFRIVLMTALVLLTVLSLASCRRGGVAATEILSAKIRNDRDTVIVEATLSDEYLETSGRETLYLLSVGSCEDDYLVGATVLSSSPSKKNMRFKFSLEENKLSSSNALVVAKKTSADGADRQTFAPITEFEYITNPELLSTTGIAPLGSKSLKGISSAELSDALYLACDRMIVDVNIEKLMLNGYSEGAESFVFNGVTYYFSKAELDLLDKTVSEATALGVRVYLRSTLGSPEETTPEYLYCAGAAKNAAGYCVNMADGKAAEAIRALYSLLGARYSGKGALALDHIIGKTVNLYPSFCNAGGAEGERFYSLYGAWARVASNALLSANSSATVYIPLDNSLQTEGGGAGIKTFLENFAKYAAASGNYGYGIAIDLGHGEDLGKLLSGNTEDYLKVGVGNLYTLSELLDRNEMRWHGQRRDVIIDSIALDDIASDTNKAAYAVCAYYKAAETGFDAIFYTLSGEVSDAYASAIRLCGDKAADKLSEIAKKIPLEEPIDVKANVTESLIYEKEVNLEIGRGSLSNKRASGIDLCDVTVLGSAYNADAKVLTTPFGTKAESVTVSSAISSGDSVAVYENISASKILEAGYIALTLGGSGEADAYFTLFSDTEKRAVYIGEFSIFATKKTYYFDVKKLTDRIKGSDKLTLAIVVESKEGADNYDFTVDEIALYGSSGNGLGTTLTAVGVFAAVLAVCGLLFLLTRRRNRRTGNDRKK